MLSEDGDSRFANLRRTRSIPTFLSEVEAVQFQLTELLTLRAADGVGVLRLRDATCFRTRYHYAQDDMLIKS